MGMGSDEAQRVRMGGEGEGHQIRASALVMLRGGGASSNRRVQRLPLARQRRTAAITGSSAGADDDN
jgi:hypothetical protein